MNSEGIFEPPKKQSMEEEWSILPGFNHQVNHKVTINADKEVKLDDYVQIMNKYYQSLPKPNSYTELKSSKKTISKMLKLLDTYTDKQRDQFKDELPKIIEKMEENGSKGTTEYEWNNAMKMVLDTFY